MTVDLSPAAQQALAVALYQRSWELLTDDRDDGGDRELIESRLATVPGLAGG